MEKQWTREELFEILEKESQRIDTQIKYEARGLIRGLTFNSKTISQTDLETAVSENYFPPCWVEYIKSLREANERPVLSANIIKSCERNNLPWEYVGEYDNVELEVRTKEKGKSIYNLIFTMNNYIETGMEIVYAYNTLVKIANRELSHPSLSADEAEEILKGQVG